MRHRSTLSAMLLFGALCAPALLSAQQSGPAKAATPTKAKGDTTVRYLIPDRDGVKIMLQGGFVYAAVLDGRELMLQVKPTVENLRDPAIGDATLPSEKVTRFTITVEDTGLYVFSLTGAMPGRDVSLDLTGPALTKKKTLK